MRPAISTNQKLALTPGVYCLGHGPDLYFFDLDGVDPTVQHKTSYIEQVMKDRGYSMWWSEHKPNQVRMHFVRNIAQPHGIGEKQTIFGFK